MDFVNVPLLAAALLVFISVLAGMFSAGVGFSFLLVFLVAGVLAGEDGIGGYRFDNFGLSFWVGNLALAVILLDGGLRTAYSTFRTGLKPAGTLATLGVLICAGLTAVAGWAFAGLDWPTAMLLGAIVGSTDAAAVFALLTRSGVRLSERLAATLEIESGVNDPTAIYLTLAFIAIISSADAAAFGTAGGDVSVASTVAVTFVQQFGWGTLIGLGSGFLGSFLIRRVSRLDPGGGVMALLLCASGLVVFAATGLLGGSGFLAIYLYGLLIGNRAERAVATALPAMDGYAWLAQAGMFLLLGLLVTPSSVVETIWPALGVSAVLMLVARPVAVWLCLKPFRFNRRERTFVAWVGLRGAVPIVLAMFPLINGTPQSGVLFNIAFVVVLCSLLIQGSTIGYAARRLGVALPDPTDEPAVRKVFRDFALDPATWVRDICAFYGLPEPEGADRSLASWMRDTLHRPPVVGDTVELGHATLVVRKVVDGRIAGIGMGLPENPEDTAEPDADSRPHEGGHRDDHDAGGG